jgi:S1-C subfamily serine protease
MDNENRQDWNGDRPQASGGAEGRQSAGDEGRVPEWWPTDIGAEGGETPRGLAPSRPRRRSSVARGLGIAGAAAAVVLLSGLGGAWVAGQTGGHAPLTAAVRHDARTVSSLLAQTTSVVSHPAATLTVAQVANRVEPAVVDISVVLAGGQGEAAGTGMILTPNGEVLTNNHVIYDAASIRVKIAGRSQTYPARVLGYDEVKDVALVQIEGVHGLPTVKLDTAPAYIGEPVVAIGNALDLPGKPTVTSGTITATGRAITASSETMNASEHLQDMLQTDAALAPGDSGGPLVNRQGQVVGMDTAAYSGSSVTLSATTSSDVGFAIPIANALDIVHQIQAGHGTAQIQIGSYAMMGIEALPLSDVQSFGPLPVGQGVFVDGVLYGTGAAAAGLQYGDIITKVNGVTVTGLTQLQKLIRAHKPGQTVSVTWVTPYGGQVTAHVKLSEAPPQ